MSAQIEWLFWNSTPHTEEIKRLIEEQQPVGLVGRLQVNEWAGSRNAQFVVEDVEL